MFNHLKSDCKNCFGLCCVALPYAESADFPFNKDGGEPCRHLCSNNLCSIHDQLRGRGFHGCVSYECFGAGQHVSQSIYKGEDWREDLEHAEEMFTVFPLVQQLFEMLWYLKQALTLKETQSFHAGLQKMYEETVELTEKKPKEILEIDIVAHRNCVNDLLKATSKVYRADIVKKGKKKRIKKGLDYIGANLKGLNLQGEDFRGKLMIAANLSQSDLRKADFIGADLRGADLRGADLTKALFLTQSQINSATGNTNTRIPGHLDKPSHWLNKKIS
ncbi:BTB/POZ domain-containing protein [Pseudalkalibacillus salsuginis]|uniref:BTB/POZ domain-containing protein n=1 Tax=Pseudalkalibacillus salsuginis TaxID=2910972 RepID=UPI001F2657EE|nr:BTB/POZ domain-containing protein [Pseudalkalibacillus salsuginis]MCF6409840.1 BTB/POZ domain-containing protein [Pseudalkalibacillus salsuginis]